MRVLILPLK